MRYCILGSDGVAGGYVVEMHILMEQWCRTHCRGGYTVLDHGEIRFEDQTDALAFGRKWFMPEAWQMRPMRDHCRPAHCASVDYSCPHSAPACGTLAGGHRTSRWADDSPGPGMALPSKTDAP
jgi:hypothetical protein